MWLIAGLIVGGAILALFFWLRNRGTKVNWYEWLIGIAGVMLLLLAAQNYFGLRAEFEEGMGNWILLAVGLPAIILMALAASLVWRRHRTAKA